MALRVLLSTAHSSDALVIAGNGDVARRVAVAEPGVCKVVLEGAMGMGAAIALGYKRFSARRVIVIEGDGNRLLGAPAAEWLSAIECGVLHAVLVNGVFATSGGQRLPVDLVASDIDGIYVEDLNQLEEICQSWLLNEDACRLLIREESMNSKVSVERPKLSLEAMAAIIIEDSRTRWR
jgi:hypothetical protein